MTTAELDRILREYTPVERIFYERFRQSVPENDRDAESRYIELMDLNRPAFDTPQLYYNVEDNGETIEMDFSELQRRALKEKRLPTVIAEQNGIKKWLYVQKHNRFMSNYDHSHSFVEMNYMYSGRCVNIVEGREIAMEPGDIVLMSPGCVHRIVWTGENDILINIVLLPVSEEMILDNTLAGKSDLSAFLVDAVYSRRSSANYLCLRFGECSTIMSLINLLMCEYFDSGQVASDIMAESCLRGIFALIHREMVRHPGRVEFMRMPNSRLAEIIGYIQSNCVTCTRESAAEHFGYSGSRITNILTEGIGKGFVQIRNEFRMILAEKYLSSTALPVTAVAEMCGFTNMTQFYRNFHKYFGRLPRE